jgi:flagellar hook-associated protein 3 FlgL
MQISTSYRFDRAIENVTRAQQALAKSQTQLGTGKQLVFPSDEPVKAQLIERLGSALSRQESVSNDLQTIQHRFEVEETAVRASMTALTSFKDQVIQGGNDTNASLDRKALGVSLRNLREQLVELANARDRAGQYVFGGSRVGEPPFVEREGVIVYEGDQTSVFVTTGGDQRLQQYNRSGADVFARIVRQTADGPRGVEFFDVLDDAIAAVESGDRPSLDRGLREVDELYAHATLTLADIGASQTNVEVQLSVTDDMALRLKAMRSEAEDVDYAQAVSEMSKQMLALEAAMSSLARISELNLFSYLGR